MAKKTNDTKVTESTAMFSPTSDFQVLIASS